MVHCDVPALQVLLLPHLVNQSRCDFLSKLQVVISTHLLGFSSKCFRPMGKWYPDLIYTLEQNAILGRIARIVSFECDLVSTGLLTLINSSEITHLKRPCTVVIPSLKYLPYCSKSVSLPASNFFWIIQDKVPFQEK